MAKIKGPLYSVRASGMIGERLTFSHRASGQQARFQKKQTDIITVDRQAVRDIYTLGVAAWNILSISEKGVYKTDAISMKMTGYNYFMKRYILSQVFAWVKAIYGQGIYGGAVYGKV